MKIDKMAITASALILGLGLVSTSITHAQLVPDRAVGFNGTNSYGTIVNQSFMNGATVTDFTIDVWVKNERPEIHQMFGGKTEYWKEWGIYFYAGGGIGFGSAWPNSYYNLATTNGVMKSNQWQHIAVVGQGTLGSIYVDGALVSQQNNLYGQLSFNAAVSGSAIAGMTLGFRDNTTLPDDSWFKGALADYRIWDVALSPSQVAALYSTQPPTNAPGLRHWMPFNEGTGSTFTDIIGGVQGQFFNTTWLSSVPCSPHAARATAILYNDFVVDATITDGGCGYTNPPLVLIQGGGGSGATATATISNGVVTAIHITNAGSGYTSVPTIVIASPPFVPTVSISVSKVKVTQHVTLGRNYVLEASPDLQAWTPTGPQFTAEAETIVNEFDVEVTGRYFRIRQVP